MIMAHLAHVVSLGLADSHEAWHGTHERLLQQCKVPTRRSCNRFPARRLGLVMERDDQLEDGAHELLYRGPARVQETVAPGGVDVFLMGLAKGCDGIRRRDPRPYPRPAILTRKRDKVGLDRAGEMAQLMRVQPHQMELM